MFKNHSPISVFRTTTTTTIAITTTTTIVYQNHYQNFTNDNNLNEKTLKENFDAKNRNFPLSSFFSTLPWSDPVKNRSRTGIGWSQVTWS